MHVQEILANLVSFPSVVRTSNAAIIDYIRSYLAQYGVNSSIIAGPEGDRFNLFATIGPADLPGYILSGHLDVVPATESTWSSDPFRLREDGERLIARGAVDMKGFVACVLASVPAFVSQPLKQPIHLAFSYDEEAGCIGVRHLIDRLPTLCAKPIGCFVGEPSGMQPVLRHKGKIGCQISVYGKSGHSSRPDLGLNAIHASADIVATVRDEAARLAAEGPFNERFAPPYSSMQVGVIAGGAALNVIPEKCTIDIEARAVPGIDPATLMEPIKARIAELSAGGSGLRFETQVLSSYPALDLNETDGLAALAERISGQSCAGAVSFGTEAGLYQAAGIPSIICGPGDIARAHRPNEYVLKSELDGCLSALGRLTNEVAA
ncbi:acetylornithine deacetylase [Phyllobacterium sp. LjRoot231]|uniref:acetylornithine deacetylase n=1 Tax=Phyllobacterium sp. LjRoot231 TaxID=3342289 RepID=UPI003ECFBED7